MISFLFCVFLSLGLVHCTCRSNSLECVPTVSTSHESYREGYTIVVLFLDSILDCFLECMSPKHTNCSAVAFQSTPDASGLHRCELKDMNKSNTPDSDAAQGSGYEFIDVLCHVSKTVSICARFSFPHTRNSIG